VGGATSKQWSNVPVVARCSAQLLASAASLSLQTSGGTPTAARSLLWISRKVLAISAVFSVLLAPCAAFPLLSCCALPVLLLSCAFPLLLLSCFCGGFSQKILLQVPDRGVEFWKQIYDIDTSSDEILLLEVKMVNLSFPSRDQICVKPPSTNSSIPIM
jgi:hypothetical protein